MKRKRIALVLALFFSFFLTACTQKASDPNQDNWAKYQKQGSITVEALTIPLFPWDLRKEWPVCRFDIDLAQAVSEKLGIQIKFQPIDWDMKETELQNGTIDAIWNGYTATDERKEKVAFTIPYMENPTVWSLKKFSKYPQFRI